MADFAIVPERMALVNVDMQNCFVHGSPFSAPDGLAVQERINRVPPRFVTYRFSTVPGRPNIRAGSASRAFAVFLGSCSA